MIKFFQKTKYSLSFKFRRFLRSISKILIKIGFFFSRIGKIIKAIFSVLSKNEKRTLILLLIMFLFGLFLQARQKFIENTVAIPSFGGKVIIAEVGEPEIINPIFATSEADLDAASFIYSGLVKRSINNKITPDLAKQWEISQDKTVYTFQLYKDAKWHDEVELTSDDIIFTISLISDPNYVGPFKGVFDNIIVERVTKRKLKFILDDPYTPFIKYLDFGILPAHLLSNYPIEQLMEDPFNLAPIGSGPFKFERLSKNKKQLNLIGVKDHFSQSPYLEELQINYYEDGEKAFEAFQKGEVTAIANISNNLISGADSKDNNIYKVLPPNYMALFINTDNNILEDVEIRKAIAHAIDKENIIDNVLYGQGAKISGPLLPEFLGYSDDFVHYKFDAQIAKQTLTQNKWTDSDKNGVRDKGGQELSFNLVTTDSGTYQEIAEMIKEQLAKIGINIEIISSDILTIQNLYLYPRKYDLLLFGESLGADPDPYPFWHSSQTEGTGLNLSNFSHSEVDNLLEEARQTDDLNERTKKYIEFQKLIADEVPAVFLFRPFQNFGTAKNIKGVRASQIIDLDDKFCQVNNWYIKEKRGAKE